MTLEEIVAKQSDMLHEEIIDHLEELLDTEDCMKNQLAVIFADLQPEQFDNMPEELKDICCDYTRLGWNILIYLYNIRVLRDRDHDGLEKYQPSRN